MCVKLAVSIQTQQRLASAYRTMPVEISLPFDHVAFVSQWQLYTRIEKYTEIVLRIEFVNHK